MGKTETKSNKKDKTSMIWFNFYTKFMIIFCILHVLSLSYYGNYFLLNDNYNIYIIISAIFDIALVVYEFHTYYSLKKQDHNSILKLIVLLWINYILRIIVSNINVYNPDDSITQNIIIFVLIYSIYYIPNLIYFTRRKDIFNIATEKTIEEENNSWQSYLDKNYKPAGTITSFEDIKLPTAQKIQTPNIENNNPIKTKTKNTNKVPYKKSIIIIIASSLIVILSAIGIYNLVNYIDSLKNDLKLSKRLYNTLDDKYYSLKRDYSNLETQKNKSDEKIEFFDENIVFVINGYGNYYYSYDEMKYVTSGNRRLYMSCVYEKNRRKYGL